MKCDRCEQEATVHELRVVNGQKVEKHMCETCAREEGIQPPGSVGELVGQLMMAAVGQPVTTPTARGLFCPKCKTSFAEFRQNGMLGCPECYRVFEAQLAPLLERAHEGGTRHVGKIPPKHALERQHTVTPGKTAGESRPPEALKSAKKAIDPAREKQDRLASLLQQLAQAVQSEQYERAAALRDEIKKVRESM